MNLNDYQQKSRATAIYPAQGSNYVYPTLGLVSESGEVADHVKRIERDDRGIVTESKRANIAGELGDVLWYVAQLATEFNLSLTDIATANLAKLNGRRERGTLSGAGDR